MAKSAFAKAIRAGKAGALMIGLAVMLALVFGAATTAMGATGGNFILGKANGAATMSRLAANISGPALQLVNNSTGAAATALNLSVRAGKAPLTVSAGAGTATNLSADKLDGKDSSQFAAGVNGKATNAAHADQADNASSAQNAETLDGLNSTDLVRSVHATIEPTYGTATVENKQHLLTLPTGDRIDWGCRRYGTNYYGNDLSLSPGSGGTRRTVIVQEIPGLTWVHQSYGGVGGGHGNNDGTRNVDTYTLRTTTMNSPSPFVATVEVVVNYRQDTCHISAQGTVSGGV